MVDRFGGIRELAKVWKEAVDRSLAARPPLAAGIVALRGVERLLFAASYSPARQPPPEMSREELKVQLVVLLREIAEE